jgi:hypothetical protein
MKTAEKKQINRKKAVIKNKTEIVKILRVKGRKEFLACKRYG